MNTPELDPRLIRMPHLNGMWLGAAVALGRTGQPVGPAIIDFWDYTCLNCLRTLPYLRAWHERYQSHGLAIIGVHSPEFTFAAAAANVSHAIDEWAIPYPIMLDKDHRLWDAFAVRAWPTKFLIDHNGYIRYSVRGEGQYGLFEQALRQVLHLFRPTAVLPDAVALLREEDRPGAVCFRPTAEVYTGYQFGAFWHGRLGNPEGFTPDVVNRFTMPALEARVEGHVYLEGIWIVGPESVRLVEGAAGRMTLLYRGATANVVIGDMGDRTSPGDGVFEIRQDGQPVRPVARGADIVGLADGRTVLLDPRPRMAELVRNDDFALHELELIVSDNCLPIHTFSFSGCAVPGVADASLDTYIVQ